MLLDWALLFCSLARAIDVETKIEPAHAADQSRVSTSMLIEEFQQYKSIANWHQNIHQLEIAKARLKQTESEYERAKKLAGPKSFGDKRLAIAISQYDASLIEVSRLEYEVLLAKAPLTYINYVYLKRVIHKKTIAKISPIPWLLDSNMRRNRSSAGSKRLS